MAFDDDVDFFERIPTLKLLGPVALTMLANGVDRRDLHQGQVLFKAGDPADAGYVIEHGELRVSGGDVAAEVIARRGMLIGELAMIAVLERHATATAMEASIVIRISRNLFLGVLENHPEAARRLRNFIALRTRDVAGAMTGLTEKLR